MMEKKDICIIRTKLKQDYVFDAIKHYGFNIQVPYRGDALIPRIIREIWFRCRLPFRSLWYKNPIKESGFKIILMYDPLILPHYIEWVHRNNPEARIVLSYENRADKTINPDSVPSYVEKWSYDHDDCDKYSMKWISPSFFTEYVRKPKNNPKYDVLFVGRDKGRAKTLFSLEAKLRQKGLKTLFYICADRKFLRFKKKFYRKLLTYEEYLDLQVDSKSILNIVPEGQTSITQREMEAFFSRIKCLTNNMGVLGSEMYDPNLYFILGHDNLDNIADFMLKKVSPISEELIRKYDFAVKLMEMFEETGENGCDNPS